MRVMRRLTNHDLLSQWLTADGIQTSSRKTKKRIFEPVFLKIYELNNLTAARSAGTYGLNKKIMD